VGYCEVCGSALDPVARSCMRCGAPAPVTVAAGEATGTVWAPPPLVPLSGGAPAHKRTLEPTPERPAVPNGDYSVALPTEPTLSGDTITSHVASDTLTVSDRDLGAFAAREPLARVKQLQDLAALAGFQDDESLGGVKADHDLLTLDWNDHDESKGPAASFFLQHRALLVGSHFFVLTASEVAARDGAFGRLSDSFRPNPALSSF
jgi:hypothetical protein